MLVYLFIMESSQHLTEGDNHASCATTAAQHNSTYLAAGPSEEDHESITEEYLSLVSPKEKKKGIVPQ